MNPITVLKLLNSTGLGMDLIGAGLLAIDVFRRFHGIKLLAPRTYNDLSSPPKESAEFKTWDRTNFRFNIWGFVLLVLGFGLQIAALWFPISPQ